jgi:hypothetical protein
MRWFPAVVLRLAGLAALLGASAAHADATCDTAYDQAQTFRDAKKLLEAREQLRACARATCPASVVKECTNWLSEIEARIPSVLLVATDAKGAALPNVSVTVDGAATPRSVDGTSWEMNAGQHTFTFQLPDGTKIDKTTVVVEAQKDQRIVVLVGPPPPKPSILKPVGYVVGGVGVAGLILGAVTGGLALAEKGSKCTNDQCTGNSANGILTLGKVSTGAFVAGGILAAGGVTLILVAPSGKSDSQGASLQAAPLVGAGAGGAMLLGRW